LGYKLSGLERLQGEGRAELLRFEGAEPLVGDEALAEYVEESRPTGVIVVPESTVEALRVYCLLREKLGRDKVALVFMPGVHKENLGGIVKRLPDEVRRTIEVDCSAVFNAFNVKPEGGGKGVSLKLLQHHGTGEWGRLRRGAEALRGLSPGRLGLVDVLRGLGCLSLQSTAARPVSSSHPATLSHTSALTSTITAKCKRGVISLHTGCDC